MPNRPPDAPKSEDDVLKATEQTLIKERERRRLSVLRGRRNLHLARAALVGICAGGLAVLFQWALYEGELARSRALAALKPHPAWGWAVLPVVGFVMCGLSGYLVSRFAPNASGSGIPHVKAVLLNLRPFRWIHILAVKFVGGVLAIAGGLSLGREGPTVQMGAALARGLSSALKVSRRTRHQLIACGAGAGLAAAFNAPLAGFIFVLEELQRELSPLTYGAALVAAVCADVVTRAFTGQMPSFHIHGYPTPPLTALPLFCVVGLAAGIGGVAFNKSILGCLKFFHSRKGPAWLWPALIGSAAGLMAWWIPQAVGGGHVTAEQVLTGQFADRSFMGFVVALMLAKFALTIFSYGSGAPGGIFAPLLVIGSLIGLLVGQVGSFWFPRLAQTPAAFSVVGMAAYFTSIVRAPLTGIVLILEMTGNYEQLFPLVVTCLISYLVAESLRDKPIYEALLDYDLHRREPDVLEEEEPILVDFAVEPGSAMAGRMVKNLGLPKGTLLVTVKRAGREIVPSGDTHLHHGDEITVIVAGGSAAAIRQIGEAAKAPSE